MFGGLGSKLKTAGVLLVAIIVAAFKVRNDARRDERRDAQIKDYENAQSIDAAVRDIRNDPDRLRKYEDAGYRD